MPTPPPRSTNSNSMPSVRESCASSVNTMRAVSTKYSALRSLDATIVWMPKRFTPSSFIAW